MKKRVADIIIETLIENGITDCFAVVGGGAMYLDNALALNNNIHKYFNHHEQACAIAAEAYARVSGNMAAVCVTSGPGATNAITGVMGAWQDSLPMIVLSGQVRYAISVEKSGLPLRYRGIQEFEIIPSVKNMTKYAVMITDPLNIKYEVQKAIDIARDGRQGPVWLDIPQDIQNAQVDIEHLKRYSFKKEPLSLTDNEYEFILETLQKAKRPCILAGNGIANSGNTKAFRKMAEGLKVPVIAAAIAADVMYREHPLYYGLSGSIGPRTGNFIVQNADVILVLGCSMGFKMTGFAQEYFAPNATILAIDIDENEMKKPGVRIDYFFKCNLKDFFAGFEQFSKQVEISDTWRIYCDNLRKRFSPFEPSENLSPDERVCSYYFWKKYDDYETDNSISVLGNNTASSAKLQIGIRKENQRIVANNNCGSMGADLPEAIGASVASQKTVICLTGDGSIMMNLQELQTIRHYNLPVKIVIFSNDGYNAIRQTAKNFFNGKCIGCTPESGVSFPDFHSVADTFGFKYKCCNCNAEVEDSLKWLFSSEASVLLEVKQRLDDPVIPKVMTRLLDDGNYSTPAIQDMYPFLDKDDYDELMFW